MDNNIINLELFRTLSSNNIENNIENNTEDNIKNVLYMIEDIENGKEPIMFKICMGTATSDEIIEWANEQGLETGQIENTIKELKLSFTEGAKIAENIENPPDHESLVPEGAINNIEENMTDEVILNKLNTISEQLDTIKKDVKQISDSLKNRK